MAHITFKPSDFFNCVEWTGNDSNRSIAMGHHSSCVWIKKASGSGGNKNWQTFDNVPLRGPEERFVLNGTQTTATSTDKLSAFTNTGFNVGSSNDINGSSADYMGYSWAAGSATESKTYKVVVVSDSGNKYRFRNSTDTATFAQSAVTLDLQEGGTYTFDQSDASNATHPFRFSTSADGADYTTGVTTNGTPGQAGAYTRITVAASAPTLYYKCSSHSGMGGQINTNVEFGSTNLDGTIQTTTNVTSTAGVSIMSFSIGTLSNGSYTLGHGLGDTPAIMVIKGIDVSSDWYLSTPASANNEYLRWNISDAPSTAGSRTTFDRSGSALTSTFFSADYNNILTGTNKKFLAYAWAQKKGFSRFGTFTGNGDVDGPFVYTGFKPALFFYHSRTSGKNWLLQDKVRSLPVQSNFNQTNTNFYMDGSNDNITYGQGYDQHANGIKLRITDSHANASGHVYDYFAFADTPMTGINGTPGVAR